MSPDTRSVIKRDNKPTGTDSVKEGLKKEKKKKKERKKERKGKADQQKGEIRSRKKFQIFLIG